MTEEFKIWAWGDAHVMAELKREEKRLSGAIHDSETDFSWDIALDVGDMSSEQGLPTESEGKEIVSQFKALEKHPREAIYNVCGNHDRNGLHEEPAVWWKKWIDPEGKNTEYSQVDDSKRPYPIAGDWERYSFRVGNILFLMMSDINEPSQTIGRGDLGGNPAGVVSGETFEWWKKTVEANQNSIIISAHHYMLKDTTVASGEWEGLLQKEDGEWRGKYHGYKPEGAPKGASYLYFVDSKPDAQAFEGYLAEHPGAIDFWLGGHTHAHPDADDGGKSHIETKWETHFINVGALTRYHTGPIPNPPKSRLFTFTEGSKEVKVQCYMHTDEFLPKGWYDKAERVLTLSKEFHQD